MYANAEIINSCKYFVALILKNVFSIFVYVCFIDEIQSCIQDTDYCEYHWETLVITCTYLTAKQL